MSPTPSSRGRRIFALLYLGVGTLGVVLALVNRDWAMSAWILASLLWTVLMLHDRSRAEHAEQVLASWKTSLDAAVGPDSVFTTVRRESGSYVFSQVAVNHDVTVWLRSTHCRGGRR